MLWRALLLRVRHVALPSDARVHRVPQCRVAPTAARWKRAASAIDRPTGQQLHRHARALAQLRAHQQGARPSRYLPDCSVWRGAAAQNLLSWHARGGRLGSCQNSVALANARGSTVAAAASVCQRCCAVMSGAVTPPGRRKTTAHPARMDWRDAHAAAYRVLQGSAVCYPHQAVGLELGSGSAARCLGVDSWRSGPKIRSRQVAHPGYRDCFWNSAPAHGEPCTRHTQD